MPKTSITFSHTIEDDSAALDEAIRRGLDRPLLLWGHPGTGAADLLEAAARKAGLPYREIGSAAFEGFDGFRDVSDSGHFRQVTLERFLARGDRADPAAFTLSPSEVLHIRGLNQAPKRLVQSVVEQLFGETKLLGNPLPPDVRIVATALPSDERSGRLLLGDGLLGAWKACSDRAPLEYPVYALPANVLNQFGHWALLPSVNRFLALSREKGLAEEMIRFLDGLNADDPVRATAILHASLIRESEPLQQLPSPRAFSDLGSLLVERRPYFSGWEVKEAIARSTSLEEFQSWLYGSMQRWDPDHWIEATTNLTVRGESESGNVWLRQLIAQIRAHEAQVGIEEITAYAAHERRSLAMWATQELGDEIGLDFVSRTAVSDTDLSRWRETIGS